MIIKSLDHLKLISKKIADKVRQLRNHGMSKSLKSRYSSGYPWIFDITEPGYNYRLDEIRASLGISQLKRIKKITQWFNINFVHDGSGTKWFPCNFYVSVIKKVLRL